MFLLTFGLSEQNIILFEVQGCRYRDLRLRCAATVAQKTALCITAQRLHVHTLHRGISSLNTSQKTLK